MTRLPYVPVERVDFLMYRHKYRNRSVTLAATVSSTDATTITVTDNSNFLNHDLLFVDGLGRQRHRDHADRGRPAGLEPA